MTQTQAQPETLLETKPSAQSGAPSGSRPITDWQSWLATFEEEHGRRPRILHIGNVANNGYNNAKVLVEAGFDCDALCYDYYHIMGCPEWEDGDFRGMVSDHFFPHWGQVDLNGFDRPIWFSQGPRLWAVAYLLAKHDRRRRCTKFLWNMLAVQRWFIAHRSSWWYRTIKGTVRRLQYWTSKTINWISNAYARASAAVRAGTNLIAAGFRAVSTVLRRIVGSVNNTVQDSRSTTLQTARRANQSVQARLQLLQRIGHRMVAFGRRVHSKINQHTQGWIWPIPLIVNILLYFAILPPLLIALVAGLLCLPFALVYHAVAWLGRVASGDHSARGAKDRNSASTRQPKSASGKGRLSLAVFRFQSPHTIIDRVRCRVFRRLTGIDLPSLHTPAFDRAFYDRAGSLIEDFQRRFPDREDQLTLLDMVPYLSVLPLWTELFRRYDLIEAYATDPILTMLAGVEPCVAYEHGTIREIPFHDSPTARLTALAYARAQAVVITNPDCKEAAEQLGVERFVPIPHLIDRKYYNPMIADAGDLPPQIRPPYLFSPARHDWDVKGTHILLGAFARIADKYPDLQLVTPSWGGDLDRSRDLINSLGIADRVAMIEPVNIHNLIRVTRGARVLVDQFRFGVFGGIGPTALAVGTPLITHLDHSKSDWWMEPPPYFEAWDEDSCVDALNRALTADAGALRADLRAWMRRNYWHGHVVDRHACLFAELIEASQQSDPRHKDLAEATPLNPKPMESR